MATKQEIKKAFKLANLLEELKALSVVQNMNITQETKNELYLLHKTLWDRISNLINNNEPKK